MSTADRKQDGSQMLLDAIIRIDAMPKTGTGKKDLARVKELAQSLVYARITSGWNRLLDCLVRHPTYPAPPAVFRSQPELPQASQCEEGRPSSVKLFRCGRL
jgi:hypothetical protein